MDSFLSFFSDIFKDVVTCALSIILVTLLFACGSYCCKILQRWYKCAMINRVGDDQKKASEYIITNRKKASKFQLFFLDQTGIMLDSDYIIEGIIIFLFSLAFIYIIDNVEIPDFLIPGFLKELIIAVYPVFMALVFLFFVIIFVWCIYSLITKARIVPLIVFLLYLFLCFHGLIF